MNRLRINLIFFLTIILGMAVIGRLYSLQVLKGDYWRAIAQGQQIVIDETSGERGSVYFSGGQILATNEKGKFLHISPKKIKDKEKTAKAISSIVNLPENEILEKAKKNDYFELIKKRLTAEEINSLKRLNLEGVYFSETIFRNYPQGTMASQVIGFLNEAGQGQYGTEGYYDEILKGREELEERLRTPFGYLTPLTDERKTNGADIWLTLDYSIQFMAEKLLQEAKENLDIQSGQIIVMEPRSGRILALANFPSFDPSRYKEYAKENKFETFQNSAIQKIFEPGSVFKPLTMAAALEEGKITPQTTYFDEGKIQLDGRTIYNFGQQKWGERTMTEVLEKSINTGAIFAQRALGAEKFLKYLDSFKLFEPTYIELEGEIFSENRKLKKGKEIDFATASFGQGIEITPLQLMRAFSAIANEGKLAEPHIVDSKTIKIKPELSQNVISSKTASQLAAMMVNVVESGFGKKAKIPGYYIAGKTGTAQVPFEDKKGYYLDRTVQSFIGFAPAFDPEFLILVKFDNPKAKSAEYSAAPIFHDLAKYIIDYRQIPPDYE
jgi:cell division protein FtsI/penicillin-binding protein 2